MTTQKDFWKPKPYDFEAIVAKVDILVLSRAHGYGASAHVSNQIRRASVWASIQNNHDNEDYLHFMRAGIGRSLDAWDNRRKASTFK